MALLLACGDRTVRDVCLTIRSGPDLNRYDGQAHVVALYFFPLETSAGFRQTPVEDLLAGNRPPGALAEPISLTVGPREARDWTEPFPALANEIGVVADFYRAPGDPEGTRKQVVPADCGRLGRPTLLLATSDLLLE